jgi:excisionase family DNA binding protein
MKYYTVKEVADILHTTDTSIKRWIKSGKLRAIALVGQYRVSQEQLDEFLKGREVKIKKE